MREKNEMTAIRQMDVESLAKCVFRRLKEKISPHSSPSNSVSVVELRKGLFSSEPEDDDHRKLLEAIALLERRGLVVRGLEVTDNGVDVFNRNINLASYVSVSVYLTSMGMKSDFDDGIEFLVDKPQEIVNKLEQVTGELDKVVRHYYLESIRANQEGLYISSVICLGAASERAIHWLAQAIESYSQTHQKEIEKRRSGNISRLIKYLSDTVIPNTLNEYKDLTNLKKQLHTLADIYRKNRNEAGHPKTVDQSWSKADQYFLLSEFREYITTICKARKFVIEETLDGGESNG